MQAHWLRREGGDQLVVVILGWACDHRVIPEGFGGGFDLLAVYDYRDAGNAHQIRTLCDVYPRRRLAAWSFGVMMAARVFDSVPPDYFERAVALNGTPFPADEKFGIGVRRLNITLRGMKAGGMMQFEKTAYGEWYESLKGILSPRALAENLDELQTLIQAAKSPGIFSLHWDAALVGDRDSIFPVENMKNYWGSRAHVVPLPHYPFGGTGQILELIEHR